MTQQGYQLAGQAARELLGARGKKVDLIGEVLVGHPGPRIEKRHVAIPLPGPWGLPLIVHEHVPQMPSRQSCANAIGSSPLTVSSSFTTSSISRNDMFGLRFFDW